MGSPISLVTVVTAIVPIGSVDRAGEGTMGDIGSSTLGTVVEAELGLESNPVSGPTIVSDVAEEERDGASILCVDVPIVP